MKRIGLFLVAALQGLKGMVLRELNLTGTVSETGIGNIRGETPSAESTRRQATAQVAEGNSYGPKPHTITRVCPNCAQLFMLYQGHAARLMLPALEFIRRTRLYDRNLVLFSDNATSSYQKGIAPDISSMAKFIDWQRTQIGNFPRVHTTYCVGTSAGGYAAIASGHFLRVPVVWAFAPQTLVDTKFRVPPEDELSARCIDLADLLREHNGVTEYRIFYNEGYDMDRVAAERIASFPGVRLFPQPGKEHAVVLTMAELRCLDVFPPFQSGQA